MNRYDGHIRILVGTDLWSLLAWHLFPSRHIPPALPLREQELSCQNQLARTEAESELSRQGCILIGELSDHVLSLEAYGTDPCTRNSMRDLAIIS